MPRTEEVLRARRRSTKLRLMGKPIRIRPEEFEKAEAKIRSLHSRGMTCRAISDATGIGRRSIPDIIFRPGTCKTLPRPGYERLMALSFSEPGADVRGAQLSPEPARRRLGALWLAGYTLTFQADWLGSTNQQLSKITRGENKIIHHDLNRRIAEMYDKLIATDPEELGVSAHDKARTAGHATGRGFAPASCWDETTIDDPDAFPEWTGACGTHAGKAIHEREGTPVCEPCKNYRRYKPAEREEYALDTRRFVSLVGRHGVSYERLGEKLHVNKETIGNWARGLRRPTMDRMEDIAAYFGVHVSELME